MLERVWSCRCSKIEFWNWTIYCPIVVQMWENTHKLGVVKDHMLPWGVARKEMNCCWFVLRLQERNDVDQP